MSPDRRPCRVIALLALALLHGRVAAAADKELLDILLANGAINQVQYDQLIEKEELNEEDVRQVLVTLDEKGLNFRASDGAYSFKIGGRLHTDASGHEGRRISSQATDGTEIRRARMYFQGKYREDFSFVSEVDFADNEVSVKDFFVGYSGLPWGKFAVGHQKQPFSLAVEMSSNDIPFIERAPDTDLIIPFIDRAIGVRGEFSGDRWFLATGIYGDSVSASDGGDEGWGSALRAVWAPILGEDRVLHLGARGAYRLPEDNEVRIRSETTHMSSLFPVDTGTLTKVDNVFLVGPEAAFAYGPFSVGGEYNHVFLDRDDDRNLEFLGWHVEAAWSLTGESRAASYKMSAGEFKGLKPDRNFSFRRRDWGAWEFAARYAVIDADNENVNGGRQGVLTLGLNWYLNSALRVMFDWSRILDTNSVASEAERLNIFQSRVDFHF
ncbi:MAG: porin [Myxococcota bacterium]|nr:porin [Myxococcota bacterium]